MKQIHADWKNLPFEIITKVFQLVVAIRPQQVDSCSFAHVCKAWSYPAESALYSSISIDTLSQLQKFHSSVQNNTQLGEKVRNFRLCIPISTMSDTNAQKTARVETLNILTPLLSTHLPNLIELKEHTLYSYTSTLDALLKCRLQNLEILAVPAHNYSKDEVANYITCCLLMKNRLKNLLVSDHFLFEENTSMEQLFFNRLYIQLLYQFDKLTSVGIYRTTNETTDVLEHILNVCKSLEDITFYFTDNEADITSQINDGLLIDIMSGFIPANNIKSLKGQLKTTNDYKLLIYIMHKFPQLNSLSLNIKNGTVSAHLIDQQTLKGLFDYLFNINSYTVSNIKVDEDTIADFIGDYWKETSKPGSKRVEFFFKELKTEEVQTLLDLSKETGLPINYTSIKNYVSRFSWRIFDDFLKINGKFIIEVQLAFDMIKYFLYDKFLQYTFACCPNLQRLHPQNFAMKLYTPYSETDFSKRPSLQELYIDQCELYDGLLERWSLCLPEVKLMRLKKIVYLPSKGDSSSDYLLLEITMPCTKIDLIVFGEDYSNKSIYLKVSVLARGAHYYYQYDPSGNGKIAASTKQEYTNTPYSKRIFVCCQTKPDFLFEA